MYLLARVKDFLIAWNIQTIVPIFIVIHIAFRSICSSSGVSFGSPNRAPNWPLYLIHSVVCSSSVYHDQVQLLSNSKHSLLFLPVVRIEPANDVTRKHFLSQRLIHMCPEEQCSVIFLRLIKLMSPSTHEIILSTIMYIYIFFLLKLVLHFLFFLFLLYIHRFLSRLSTHQYTHNSTELKMNKRQTTPHKTEISLTIELSNVCITNNFEP